MIKPGQVILFKSKKHFFSRVIMRFSEKKYSHVGIIVRVFKDEVDVIEARFMKGVQYARYQLDMSKHTVVGHTEAVAEDYEFVADQAFYLLGRPYDVIGSLYLAFLVVTFQRHKINALQDNGKYFCSEIPEHLYERCGLKWFDYKKSLTPSDYYTSKKSEVIF